jgi:hypothetical protein
MNTEHAKLNPGQEPMSDEQWEIHKSCEKSQRDHKWHWKFDIQLGRTSPTQAICAHCGIEREIHRG